MFTNSSPNQGGLFGGRALQGQSLFSSPSRGQEYSPSGGGLFGAVATYGGCEQHRGKPLELFCKTDKVKVCVNCAYSEAHKSHDIDLIENMRPGMFDRGNLYEKSLKKVQDIKGSTNNIIDEKAKPFDQILKERQRNEEITRLKAWFLIQHYIDSQKVNFEKKLETKSLSENEMRETSENYKKGTNSGLVKTATETLEEIKAKFDDSVFESLSIESNEAIQDQSVNLKNELNEIYSQESGDVLRLKSHFLVKKGQNKIELETRAETESFELKLSDLKDVTSLSIIFEKGWFHEEDLNLLKVILLNLSSLDSLSLQCKANIAPQAQGLISGCSIFAHLLQSFQLAVNLPLYKLKNFVFSSDAKSMDEHNQINQLMLNLVSPMNSLKLIKIHLNHLFEDSVQKEWKELLRLILREPKEPKELKELRELLEQDEVKNIMELIKEKELEVSKKSKINRNIKIFNILEKNKNLEHIEFLVPNLEIDEFQLKYLRQYQGDASIKKFLIKAKNFTSSIPEEIHEIINSGGSLFAKPKTPPSNNTDGKAPGGGLLGSGIGWGAARTGAEGAVTSGGGLFAMKSGTGTGTGGAIPGMKPILQTGNLGRTTGGAVAVSFGNLPDVNSGGNKKGEKKFNYES